jgi:hypothetical protein
LDTKVIIAEVAKRHNVLLDPRDPALLVVSIAEIVFDEASQRIATAVAEASDRSVAATATQMSDAKAAVGQLITDSGSFIALRVQEAMAEAREDLLRELGARDESARAAARRAGLMASVSVVAACIAVAAFGGAAVALWL